MLEITCNCGHVAKGETPEKTEAEAWHRALQAHADMLKGVSVEQLEQVLERNHGSLGLELK